MRKLLWLTLIGSVFACDSSPSAPEDTAPDGILPINPVLLLDHLDFLAADSLLGRRAGSRDERRAAEYIRDRFVEYGLEPGAPGYLQGFGISAPVDGRAGLESQNVIGILPGRGATASEWVIVGAHYDHLGVQRSDSSVVFNGADDNGSGTALLLEIARRLSEGYADGLEAGANRRSLMFQAYGAEEVGLVGSTYFCSWPTVPMEDITAMVNLDMVGRLRGDQLEVIGTSSSDEWTGVLRDANTGSLSFRFSDEVLNRSDQYCFYQRRKPVLFLHTGLHAEYHTPADDVRLINESGMVKIGALALRVLDDLVSRSEPLFFGSSRPLPRSRVGENEVGAASARARYVFEPLSLDPGVSDWVAGRWRRATTLPAVVPGLGGTTATR